MSQSGQGQISSPKTLTREGLRDILRVNFELYKDEPEFFDYLTTLVIYLMEYEFERPREEHASGADPAGRIGVQRQTLSTIPTRYKVRDGCCPHCNSPVPAERKICPFCLAMIPG